LDSKCEAPRAVAGPPNWQKERPRESSFGVCRKLRLTRRKDYDQMVTIYYSTQAGSTVKGARICRAAARPSLTKHVTNLKSRCSLLKAAGSDCSLVCAH
jgi:hypothetical protein